MPAASALFLSCSDLCSSFLAQDDKKWMSLKTDGTETRCFGRLILRRSKKAVRQRASSQMHASRGGPSPAVQAGFTSKTHPAKFVALMGWDKKLFGFIRESTNNCGGEELARAIIIPNTSLFLWQR